MASTGVRVTFRLALAILVIVVFFYLFRPLYWKISATVQDIRENKQTVAGGISKIVREAQKTVGWYLEESDSGIRSRRNLRQVLHYMKIDKKVVNLKGSRV